VHVLIRRNAFVGSRSFHPLKNAMGITYFTTNFFTN
jgi:hypothetical protein